MSVAINEDKILMPAKKALCGACREVTYHANVAGSWLCIICGRDLDSPETVSALHADILVRALGRESSWRVIEALRSLGEGRPYHISTKSGLSPTAVADTLRVLYEADLVKRRETTELVGPGELKPEWRLNRASPLMTKILAVLEECEWPKEPRSW